MGVFLGFVLDDVTIYNLSKTWMVSFLLQWFSLLLLISSLYGLHNLATEKSFRSDIFTWWNHRHGSCNYSC